MGLWRRLLSAVMLAGVILPGLPGLATPADAAPRLLRWGYVVTYDPTSLASLRAAGALDFVSPGFFKLDGQGRVTGNDDPAIDAAARQAGAKLVPFVQNSVQLGALSPTLSQPAVRARAVTALVTLVDRYGYDGLQVDFEPVRAEDEAGLTAFVAELAGHLRSRGKLVSIAVPARVSDATTSWSVGYDFPALGRLCDYVVIMAYAFRTAQATTPGSFAPVGQVERAVAYAAARIPREKLLLGVGLWGYDWNTSSGGKAVTRRYPETQSLGKATGGAFGYSDADQSAWLRYSDGTGRHEVWYEDQRSVTAKRDLVTRSGLAGVALWRLGHEDPGVWPVLGSGGQGLPLMRQVTGDYAVAGGRFFTQTGGGDGRGFRVTDEGLDGAGHVIRFWSEFQRLGGVATLGYPASRRYVGPDGYTYQVFQRGVLQWRPELGMAFLANAFEQLTAAGRDAALVTVGIPPATADDGSAGDYARAKSIRLGWLVEPAIRAKFLAAPSAAVAPGWCEEAAIQLYGLPASPPVKSGPFVVQRFQRLSLQFWVEDVPGAPPKGSVVGILGGDLLKQHGLVPPEAAAPEAPA